MTRGEELGEMAFYKTPYDTWALELLQHHPVLYGFRCLYLSGCLALSPHHGAFIHPEVPLGFHLRCCGLRPLSRKKDRVITNASSQLVIFKTLTHFSTCCSQMCWTSC
ncbi:uncharacterized protein LOC144304165 isoform X1 [Canis aureus]